MKNRSAQVELPVRGHGHAKRDGHHHHRRTLVELIETHQDRHGEYCHGAEGHRERVSGEAMEEEEGAHVKALSI